MKPVDLHNFKCRCYLCKTAFYHTETKNSSDADIVFKGFSSANTGNKKQE